MRPTLPAPLLNAAFSAFLAFRHKEGAPVIGAPSLANFSSRVFPDDPHTFSDLVVECQDIDNSFVCHDIADTQRIYRSL